MGSIKVFTTAWRALKSLITTRRSVPLASLPLLPLLPGEWRKKAWLQSARLDGPARHGKWQVSRRSLAPGIRGGFYSIPSALTSPHNTARPTTLSLQQPCSNNTMPKDAAPDVMPSLVNTDLFSVKGKVAVVTGGATGLGLMMAAAFVQNGAKGKSSKDNFLRDGMRQR